MSHYIIAGGASGKERLALLGSILNGGTLELLQRLQPGPVHSFLDLGCGGGSLSLAAANGGYARQVTGIDFDAALIELARGDAAGVPGVTFLQGDATAINYNEAFEVAYARFLLSHMTDAEAVLHNLVRAAQPGGLVLVEDVDFSGHYCYPANAAFNHYVELYERAAAHNGQDPRIGLRLFALLGAAGLHNVGFDVVQPVFNSGAGKWMALYTLEKISATLVHEGLVSETELQDTRRELQAFTEDHDSLISMPRIFRAWGRKKV